MKLLFQQTAQVEEKDIVEKSKPLYSYLTRLQEVATKNDYSFDESSINLPFDETQASEVLRFQKAIKPHNLKYIILIGIGGANLGTKAVYDALNSHKPPEIIFMDTLQTPPKITATPEEVLINVVTKSERTLETNANLINLLRKYPQYKNRVLHTTSQERKEPHLKIPAKVGDRYSVFSPLGLFPLSCAGINVMALLEGAMQARRDCLEKDVMKNPAMLLAVITYLHYRKEKEINVGFYFHPQLESLGKWHRQLLAESLGKNGKGITPTVAVGTTDLHSMLQLYLDGPQDKFTEFVYAGSALFPEVYAILQGVKNSYSVRKLPFVELCLESLEEKSLGYYMQFKMMETMFLAKLLRVDAFDQPAVEEYREFANDYLQKKTQGWI